MVKSWTCPICGWAISAEEDDDFYEFRRKAQRHVGRHSGSRAEALEEAIGDWSALEWEE